MIKNRRIAWPLLFVVTGVLFIAGCGGGDSSDETAAPTATTGTTETAAITKADLITQGDDLCTSVNAAVGTIDASTSADQSVADAQKSQVYSGLASDLTALGTPTDGPAPTDVINAASALADAENTGADTTTASSDLATTAAQYGFTECANPPSAPSGTVTDGSVPSDSTDTTTTPPATTTPTTPTVPTTPTTPTPPAAPPADTGGGASPDTGGVSPGGAGSGGISPG